MCNHMFLYHIDAPQACRFCDHNGLASDPWKNVIACSCSRETSTGNLPFGFKGLLKSK